MVNGNHGDSLELLTWMMSSMPAVENIGKMSQRQTKSPKITDRSKVAYLLWFSMLVVTVTVVSFSAVPFVCAEII